MLDILALFAFPSHGVLLLRLRNVIERIRCHVSNRFKSRFQRLERRVHKSSSICCGLPVSFRDKQAQKRRNILVMFMRTYTRQKRCRDLNTLQSALLTDIAAMESVSLREQMRN